MLIINKLEKDYLLGKGYKFGSHIHKTIGGGKNKTYYATENTKLLQDLESFRKSQINKWGNIKWPN